MRRWSFLPALGILLGCASEEHRTLTIALQPFGEIPIEWMDSLTTALQQEHGARVVPLRSLGLPASAFTNVKTARYRADSLLRVLLRLRPSNVDVIIGITRRDISTTKYAPDGKVLAPEERYTDWGVFGLGYRPGRACIISSFRLGEGHTQFIQRLRKVAVHEVGHNRALMHCPDTSCVMHSAVERLSNIDREGQRFCERCRKLLH